MITTERQEALVNELNTAVALGVKHNLPAHKSNGADFWLLAEVKGRQTKLAGPLAIYRKLV